MTAPDACGDARRRLLAVAVLLGLLAGNATAQISSDQVRRRYDRNTKGTSIDDYVKKLDSDDASKRLEGVKLLGASKDKKAIEYLLQAMGDSDVRVQAKAISALGDLRATEASTVMVQHLFLRSTDENMKQLILASLGKIGDERAAQPIVEFLHRDLNPATRGTAIFALGEIGSADAVDTLTRLGNSDDDPTLRRLAHEALNKVQYHQAVRLKEVKGPSETFLDRDKPPQ